MFKIRLADRFHRVRDGMGKSFTLKEAKYDSLKGAALSLQLQPLRLVGVTDPFYDGPSWSTFPLGVSSSQQRAARASAHPT